MAVRLSDAKRCRDLPVARANPSRLLPSVTCQVLHLSLLAGYTTLPCTSNSCKMHRQLCDQIRILHNVSQYKITITSIARTSPLIDWSCSVVARQTRQARLLKLAGPTSAPKSGAPSDLGTGTRLWKSYPKKSSSNVGKARRVWSGKIKYQVQGLGPRPQPDGTSVSMPTY